MYKRLAMPLLGCIPSFGGLKFCVLLVMFGGCYVAAALQSQVHICHVDAWLRRCGMMDYPNGQAGYSKKGLNRKAQGLEAVSLKDVPLEVRRQEAAKPLYLTRYE